MQSLGFTQLPRSVGWSIVIQQRSAADGIRPHLGLYTQCKRTRWRPVPPQVLPDTAWSCLRLFIAGNTGAALLITQHPLPSLTALPHTQFITTANDHIQQRAVCVCLWVCACMCVCVFVWLRVCVCLHSVLNLPVHHKCVPTPPLRFCQIWDILSGSLQMQSALYFTWSHQKKKEGGSG